MDKISANASDLTTKPEPPPPSAAQQEKINRGIALVDILFDQTGAKSDADKMRAYLDFHKMSIAGAFAGWAGAGELGKRAIANDTAQRIHDLDREYRYAVHARREADKRNMTQASVEVFDTYSEADRAILFEVQISPHFRSGRPYADEASWRANMQAQAMITDYMATAEADPTVTEEARYAEASAILARNDVNSADWTALVLKLFGQTPDYRLDLSPEARRAVGEIDRSPRTEVPYSPGSITSQRA